MRLKGLGVAKARAWLCLLGLFCAIPVAGAGITLIPKYADGQIYRYHVSYWSDIRNFQIDYDCDLSASKDSVGYKIRLFLLGIAILQDGREAPKTLSESYATLLSTPFVSEQTTDGRTTATTELDSLMDRLQREVSAGNPDEMPLKSDLMLEFYVSIGYILNILYYGIELSVDAPVEIPSGSNSHRVATLSRSTNGYSVVSTIDSDDPRSRGYADRYDFDPDGVLSRAVLDYKEADGGFRVSIDRNLPN